MKTILILFFLSIQFSTNAQKVAKIFDPFAHQTRVISDKVQLQGDLYVSVRSIDSLIFLELDGWGRGAAIVNEHDNLVLITSHDTLVIKPTGTQGYHETGHGHYTQEYALGFKNLIKLSKENLVTIWKYSAAAVEEIRIIGSNQVNLKSLSEKVLSELNENAR